MELCPGPCPAPCQSAERASLGAEARLTWPGRHPQVHSASAEELGAAGGCLPPSAPQDSGLDKSLWALPRHTRGEPRLCHLCPRWMWGRDRRASPQLGRTEAQGGPGVPRSLHTGRTPGSWGRACRTCGPGWGLCSQHHKCPIYLLEPRLAGCGCRGTLHGPGSGTRRQASLGISRATSGHAVWLLWFLGTQAPC